MASSVIPGLSVMFLLVSPSLSLTCTSQNFTNNKLYTDCVDLPYLSSYLHWTYNSTKSSLSIAFIAPPAKSDGWIAWAINPNATGMVGSQSLIAFKDSNGSMTVNTYSISSYSSILPSKLSFNVSDRSAEYSDGLMKIFATLELPVSTVNQVWQVGGSVTDGRPEKHDFQPANLNSMGFLDLRVAKSNGTSTTTIPMANTTTIGGQGGNNDSEGDTRRIRIGFYVFLLFLGTFCF
uniref:DOMON domain-containing protein n=2 Tax=Davidia involucrata TaxID=16924 RepID=A0A5B7BWF8_DAVIN